MKQRFFTVIFDFDYTLVDSSKGVITCINYALKKMDLPLVSAEEARETIGLSLKETFLKITAQQYSHRVGEFPSLFGEHADEVMADLTYIYSDVPGIIARLKKRNMKLAIVSTKLRYRIETILKRENLIRMFDVIIGGEDVLQHKPNPEGLLKAIKKLNSDPACTIYVGDSLTDAKTAKRANIAYAAVLTGVTGEQHFKGCNALRLCKNMQDFYDQIVDAPGEIEL